MLPGVTRYPLDPTGLSTDNLIEGEIHNLSATGVRAIAPIYGAFFTESVRVFDDVTTQELVKDVQFEAVELYELPTARYGKEICAVIIITDPNVNSRVKISYQALGGEFSNQAEAILQLLEKVDIDHRPVAWPDLIAKPSLYPPSHHLHDVGDVYGFEYLVHATERVRRAIELGDTLTHDSIYRYIDQKIDGFSPFTPEILEALSAKVGFADKATLQEALDGSVDTKWMTPYKTTAAINQLAIGNAPIALNTIEKLAWAIDNDPNFLTVLEQAIAAKQSTTPFLTSILSLATAGLMARTTSGAAVARTLTAGAGVAVTNGNGSAGNPTVALATSGIAAGEYTKVTYDVYGRATAGTVLTAADIPNLSWDQITLDRPTTIADYGINDVNAYAPTLTGVGATGTWGIGVSGNAGTATKLQTARSIALTGAVTGSASFDGSANIAIAATLANSGVVSAVYGSGTKIPVLTINSKGLITSATSVDLTATAVGAVPQSAVGVANGVASLDNNGQLPASQLPASVVGAMVYQGTWNASTNVPAIVSSVGTKGHYYKVGTAGNTSINGQSGWRVGDMIAFNGTTWDWIDGGSSEVTSVAGRLGAVVLTAADIGGLAASATTDTTNAANISSGTLPAARLPAYTGDATKAAGGTVLTLANTGVTAGSYGSGTVVPVPTVDAKGRITGMATAAITPAGIGAIATTAIGTANGVAGLDATGKVPVSQLPASVLGGMIYQGTWNAATNTPALASSVGTKGHYYKVSVGGTTNIDGQASWRTGDLIAFNGTTWDWIDGGATEVTSVAGRVGAVVLSASDITGLATSATVDTTSATNITSGTLAVTRLPAFTGDVTKPVGSGVLTLANTGVTAGTYGSGIKIPVLTVNSKGLVTGASSVDVTASSVGGVPQSAVGAANGVASLDSGGRLPASQLPSSIVGAMVYQGTWNASTNTPALASGTGTKGHYYKVSVAGATLIDGQSGWKVGDLIAFNGTTWDWIDGGSSEVTSVAGRVGAVVLTAADVSGLAASATINTTNAANITSGTLPAARLPALTGDVTTTAGSTVTTLADSGVVAGTYNNVATQVRPFTVDEKGRITAVGAGVTITPAWGSITGKPTTLGGFGITDGQPLNANLTAIGGLSGTSGFLKKVSAGSWTLDTATYLTANQAIAISGDATGNGTTAIALTLANTGVAAGAYGSATVVPIPTVDAKGRITAMATATIAPAWASVTGKPTTVGAAGLTDAAVKNASNNWTAAQAPAIVTLVDGASVAWDGGATGAANSGQVAKLTLAGNRTMAAPTNIKEGALYLLRVTQDAVGSRLLTWDAAFKFGNAGAPVLTITAGKTDFLSFVGGAGNTLEFLGARLNGV